MALRKLKLNKTVGEMLTGRNIRGFSAILDDQNELIGFLLRVDDGHLVAIDHQTKKVIEVADQDLWKMITKHDGNTVSVDSEEFEQEMFEG